MPDVAFLSARVDPALKRRLATLAAREGRTVQDLVREAVTALLERTSPDAQDLPAILGRLRADRETFVRAGVRRLRLFGSIARGEARPDSDVDLAADFDPPPKLTTIANLKADVEASLGRRIDLVPWNAAPAGLREAIERDGVDVL